MAKYIVNPYERFNEVFVLIFLRNYRPKLIFRSKNSLFFSNFSIFNNLLGVTEMNL